MNKTIKYLFAVLFLIPMMGVCQIIVNTGFDDGLGVDWGPRGSGTTWSNGENNDATLILGDSREGSGSVRLTGAAGSNRSELAIRSNGYFAWQTEYWVGFSFKVNTPVEGYQHMMQWHAIRNASWTDDTTAGSNSFDIKTLGTDFLQFFTATDATKTFADAPGNATGNMESFTVPYSVGEWIDIVIHCYLDTDTDGYFVIWMNGEKIYEKLNAPTVYYYDTGGLPKTPTDYWKIGAYYGPTPSGNIQYDAARIWEGPGGYYEIVSPLGLSEGPQEPQTPSDPVARRNILIQSSLMIQN